VEYRVSNEKEKFMLCHCCLCEFKHDEVFGSSLFKKANYQIIEKLKYADFSPEPLKQVAGSFIFH
jgi:hypothetical protein